MGYGLILKRCWGEGTSGADSKMNHETCQWGIRVTTGLFQELLCFCHAESREASLSRLAETCRFCQVTESRTNSFREKALRVTTIKPVMIITHNY